MASYHYKTIRKAFGNLLIAVILLSVSSCDEVLISGVEAQRSVLIYMAANNNLSYDMIENLEALKRGMLPSNGTILVYLDVPGSNPGLFRLVKDRATNTLDLELIEQYAADERSTDPAVLTRSLRRMRDLYPAKEYGLIMSSHATGWLPAGMLSSPFLHQRRVFASPMHLSVEELPRTKTFGEYRTDPGMELNEMAAAIPYRLSFILFDACFMGSIEVLYALRNVTDYVIASPAEVLSTGFPFDLIMQSIFLPASDLTAVCDAFYHYYDNHPGGNGWRSATISLYHTVWLEELANTLRPVFDAHRAKLSNFSINPLQHYANAPVFYDLDNFILLLATPPEYELFKAALDNVVLHKQATETFFSLVTSPAYIPIHHYEGVSTYVPVESQAALRIAYRETEWNLAVGLIE